MASDPRLDPDNEPPRWVRVWWPPLSRLGVFLVGAWMATAGSSEAHIVAGSGLMLAAAGFAVARYMGGRS